MHHDLPHARDPFDGLIFQYQPILVGSVKSTYAFEALVRQSLPDGTIRGPQQLLPRLMHPEAIEEFTRYTLEFALYSLRFDPSLPGIAVNLSPEQALLPVVEQTLDTAAAGTLARLIVEITEDPIPAGADLHGAICGIRSRGTRVFLDDITPARWPERAAMLADLDGIKLDRSVLGDLLATDIEAPVRELLGTLRSSSAVIVAEGIEDASTLPHLCRRGIHLFQGFALGEPWSEPKARQRRPRGFTHHPLFAANG